MAGVEFASVTVSFFIHSTEDANRLLSFLSEKLGLFPEELQTEAIQGHFSNSIIAAKAHVTGRRAQQVAAGVFANLSSTSKAQLLWELDKSMDEHDALYLRIDRQSPNREITISDEEPIRLKFKPRFRTDGHESMKDNYRAMIR